MSNKQPQNRVLVSSIFRDIGQGHPADDFLMAVPKPNGRYDLFSGHAQHIAMGVSSSFDLKKENVSGFGVKESIKEYNKNLGSNTDADCRILKAPSVAWTRAASLALDTGPQAFCSVPDNTSVPLVAVAPPRPVFTQWLGRAVAAYFRP